MRINGSTLLKIDRLFWLAHRGSELLLKMFGNIPPNRTGKVLMIKFMGLGSIIQLASLIEKKQVDKSQIILLTLSSNRELCELLGFEDVWYIRTKNIFSFVKDCFSIALKLKSTKPHLIIDFERCSHAVGLYRNALVLFGKCSSISFEHRAEKITARQKIYPVDNFTQAQLFEQGLDLMPLKAETIPSKTTIVDPVKIIININASNYLLARRYPIEYYEQLVMSLHRWHPELEFYFTGSREEISYVNRLEEKLQNIPIHNVSGQWSLEKFSTELETCALFITGDSGPLHLAVHLRIPTLAIWGPTQPQHFGYHEMSNIHNQSLYLPCAPCFRHPASVATAACNGRVDCLKKMQPDDIAKKAMEILSTTKPNRVVNQLVGAHQQISRLQTIHD